MSNNQWDMQMLTQLENELSLNLLKKQCFDDKTIHVYSRICATCSLSFCNIEWNKSFRDLSKTRNPYCSKHARQIKSIKRHDEYIEKLKKIKEQIPSIELKYPTNEVLTQQCKVEFSCMVLRCKKTTERNLSTLFQRDDMYDESMYCCDDCVQFVASYKKNGIKILLKDTEHFNDLYEIPKYIDYITTNSSLILKFKCNSCCPNCMLPHEYYETAVINKCVDNVCCNKCLHLNNCNCLNKLSGFICLTCRTYFPKELKDKNCNTCKMCRSKYNNDNVQLTINALVSKTYSRNQKEKKIKTSELTNNLVMNLFEKQNKCCYYSNIPLGFIKYDDWKITIERLDINKNYTTENVVLTCIEFQSGFRNWNKKKWHDFCTNYHKYQEQLSPTDLLKIEKQYQFAIKTHYSTGGGYKQKTIFIDKIKKEKLCHICDKIKHLENDFTKSGLKHHKCKNCISEIRIKNKETLRGKLIILLCSSKHHNETRKQKRTISKRTDLTHTLTIEELLDMWKLQKGRCYYSNYPLNINGDYQISIERKDNKIGYTKDNCVLICLEFNVGGHEIYNLEDTKNSYSWNKEKIIYAVKTYLDTI